MSIAVSKPRRKPPRKPAVRLAAAVPEFPVARMTVPEYLSLLEHGIYADQRVELWEGWVVNRMSHGSLSARIISILNRWFSRKLPDRFAVRPQLPIVLNDSCPEPDLAIVTGPEAIYEDRHPEAAEISLLIEVSDSSLREDREIKGRIYAAAGVKEYWIVNCEESQIEIYTDPHATAKTPHYCRLSTFQAGQVLTISIAGKKFGELPVMTIFPKKK